MLTTTVEVREAGTRLKELVQLVETGNDVVLTDGNRPVARLIPVAPRVAGLHLGSAWTSNDFDAPLGEQFWMGEA
jgi:prevent-host-death family protein